jgi:hypothetical protein
VALLDFAGVTNQEFPGSEKVNSRFENFEAGGRILEHKLYYCRSSGRLRKVLEIPLGEPPPCSPHFVLNI